MIMITLELILIPAEIKTGSNFDLLTVFSYNYFNFFNYYYVSKPLSKY